MIERLTYDQIRKAIMALSDRPLEELAKGPLPEEDDVSTCRLCTVLEPLAERNMLYEQILEWHDMTGQGYSLLSEVLKGEFEQDVEQDFIDEVQRLVGEVSYARCCVVYGCAEAELESRRRGYIEEGLDIHGEPPDERTPEERREDEIAEDADRRLDAEKAGDL